MNTNPEEKFSDDPEENLRIENEILRLKMQVESNAVIVTHKSMPPAVENIFLRNVQQFEEAFQNVKPIKLYDLIRRPDYKPDGLLNDHEVPIELNRLTEVMKSNNVCLHVEGNYDARTLYRFITEELFQHETDDMQMPGMTQNFSYEEFHPNHQLDIQRRGIDFLENWFGRDFDEYSWELSDTFILPAGITMCKQDVLMKLKLIFEAYPLFNNVSFAFEETQFTMSACNAVGQGQIKGTVKYDAVMEDGEVLKIDGPFVLYLSFESSWWNIHYFNFPGFVW